MSTGPARTGTAWWAFDLTLIALCGGALLAAFLLTPGAERVSMLGFEIPELCGFRNLTGLSCPGCGLTRSWTYLAHGQVSTALRMNPLGPVLFITAALQLPLAAYRLFRRWHRRRLAGSGSCQT